MRSSATRKTSPDRICSQPRSRSNLSAGISYLYNGYWWEVHPAGILIVLIVTAFNFIGDAFRDAGEVRLQRR
jgi:ABC-type dipeptide/oligopeptide/nickel transport system permease subunit